MTSSTARVRKMRQQAREQGKMTYTRACSPDTRHALDLVLSVMEGTDERAQMRLLRSLAILKTEHLDKPREAAE